MDRNIILRARAAPTDISGPYTGHDSTESWDGHGSARMRRHLGSVAHGPRFSSRGGEGRAAREVSGVAVGCACVCECVWVASTSAPTPPLRLHFTSISTSTSASSSLDSTPRLVRLVACAAPRAMASPLLWNGGIWPHTGAHLI